MLTAKKSSLTILLAKSSTNITAYKWSLDAGGHF